MNRPWNATMPHELDQPFPRARAAWHAGRVQAGASGGSMRNGLFVSLLLLAACEPLPPQSMSDIQFPEGFQLDTQREVEVSVTLREGADPATFVTIGTPDGQPLFEGPASFAVQHGLKLRLPPGTTELVVREGRDTSATRSIAVDGAEIALQIQG